MYEPLLESVIEVHAFLIGILIVWNIFNTLMIFLYPLIKYKLSKVKEK